MYGKTMGTTLLPHSVDRGVPAAYHRSDKCSNQCADPCRNSNDRWLEISEIPAARVGNILSDPRTHTRAGASAKGSPDPRVSPAHGRMQSNSRDVCPRYRDVLLFPAQADGLIAKGNEGSLHRPAVARCDFNLLPGNKLVKVLPIG
jgi:hypothetical protein